MLLPPKKREEVSHGGHGGHGGFFGIGSGWVTVFGDTDYLLSTGRRGKNSHERLRGAAKPHRDEVPPKDTPGRSIHFKKPPCPPCPPCEFFFRYRGGHDVTFPFGVRARKLSARGGRHDGLSDKPQITQISQMTEARELGAGRRRIRPGKLMKRPAPPCVRFLVICEICAICGFKFGISSMRCCPLP